MLITLLKSVITYVFGFFCKRFWIFLVTFLEFLAGHNDRIVDSLAPIRIIFGGVGSGSTSKRIGTFGEMNVHS